MLTLAISPVCGTLYFIFPLDYLVIWRFNIDYLQNSFLNVHKQHYILRASDSDFFLAKKSNRDYLAISTLSRISITVKSNGLVHELPLTPCCSWQGVSLSSSTSGLSLPSLFLHVIVLTTARIVWPRSTTEVCSCKASLIHLRNHLPSQTFSQEQLQEFPCSAMPPEIKSKQWDD